jgi:hypothetical protein
MKPPRKSGARRAVRRVSLRLNYLWKKTAALRGETLKAGVGFIAATVFVAFLHEPVEERFIPWLLQIFDQGQLLYIYTDPRSDPDDKYNFFVPRIFIPASGRMIQDPSAEVRDNPRNFIIKGSQKGDLYNFTYESSTEIPGGGAFVGTRSRKDTVFVGSLIGLGHDKKTGQCRLTSYWAVVGSKKEKDQFANLLNEFISGAPQMQASQPAILKCKEQAESRKN